MTSVQAGGAVGAGVVVGAVVQILIAPQTAPSGIAFALPRLGAGSVLATWITFAFVTFVSGPARATFAFSWLGTFAMFSVTTWCAYRFGAVVSFFALVFGPAFKADLVSLSIAFVMAELVVSGAAQGVAVVAEIVGRTNHPVLVLELGVALHVGPSGPAFARVQLLLLGNTADQSIFSFVIFMPSFDD